MRIEEFEKAVERHEGEKDHAPALTLVGRSAKGLGVRPEIVDWMPNGNKVYLFSLKQCRQVLKKFGR